MDDFQKSKSELISELNDLRSQVDSLKARIDDNRSSYVKSTSSNNDETVNESEEKYRLLFDNMLNAFALHEIITDQSGAPINYRFLEVNKAFEFMTGLKENEIIGKTVRDLMPETEPYWIEKYGRVALNNEILNFENYSSALRKYYEVHSFSPRPGQFATVFNDITDRKEIELTILESENKYRTIVDNSYDSIFMLRNNKIVYVNPKICELSGYTKEELLADEFDINLVISPEYRTVLLENNKKRSIGDYSPMSYDVAFINRSGIKIETELTSVALKEKEEVLVIGFIRDISVRKQAEKELITAKENAEKLNIVKSNFLANISHELRTPLNGILGFAQLLTEELDDQEYKDMTQTIYRSGKRLLETLNMILDLSRIEADKVIVKLEDVDIQEAIGESIEIFSAVAESKKLYLNSSIISQNIFAYLDKNLFIGIINNLVGNALKFTEFGGINVEVNIITLSYEDWVQIKVIDTGIGIPEDKINVIFEEFRQVSEGISRNFQGNGLGLTITKKYVELMHGNISVESVFGKGSTFTVMFPAVDISSKEKSKIHSIEEISKGQFVIDFYNLPNVLLVEDDETNQLLTKMMLSNFCNIDIASSGGEALNLINSNLYNLIIMDINLGSGLNGLETTKEIRKNESYSNTPIIALTAFAMRGDREEFIANGCTHYISKPYEKEYLVNVVQDALNFNIKNKN